MKRVFEWRGVSGLVAAEIISDTADGFVTGDVFSIAGVATASKEAASSNETHYYDNLGAVVISTDGETTITFDISGLDSDVYAKITGYKYNENTGAVIEGKRHVKFYAVGFQYEDSDFNVWYSWYYKGVFAVPSSNHASINAGTDANGQTLVYTAVRTTYAFNNGSGAKSMSLNTALDLVDTSTFFDKVTTPDDLAPVVPSEAKHGLINFYDYDGTLLYGFTKAQAEALTALPQLPTHEGLVSTGWTHDLAQVFLYADDNRTLNIGALYETDDGTTRLYFFVAKGTRISNLTLQVKMGAGESAVVYWGDGTSSTLANEDVVDAFVSAAKTDYQEAEEDTTIIVSISGGSFSLQCAENRTFIRERGQQNLVKAEIGINCKAIGNYAFAYLYSLKSVLISSSVQGIGERAFYESKSLTSIIIPNSVASLGESAFLGCSALETAVLSSGLSSLTPSIFQFCVAMRNITLPENITAIQKYAFDQNDSLQSVLIPSSVVILRDYCFSFCYSLYLVDLTEYEDAEAIPELESSGVFDQSYPIFRVANQEMLDAFTAAPNWIYYASQFEVAT